MIKKLHVPTRTEWWIIPYIITTILVIMWWHIRMYRSLLIWLCIEWGIQALYWHVPPFKEAANALFWSLLFSIHPPSIVLIVLNQSPVFLRESRLMADVSGTCRAAIRLKTTLGKVFVSHVISDQGSIKTRWLDSCIYQRDGWVLRPLLFVCLCVCSFLSSLSFILRPSSNFTSPLHSNCCVSICPINAVSLCSKLIAWHTHGNVSPVNTKLDLTN